MTEREDNARLAAIEARQREQDLRMTAIETNNAVSHVVNKQVQGDVHEIKETLKWLVRLILGAFILALVAYVVAGGVSV